MRPRAHLIAIALAAGLASTAIAVLATLLHVPSTVAGTNGIGPSTTLAATHSDADACQSDETLPAGTSAIRLGLEATISPRVTVTALSGAHIIARGTGRTGWPGGEVTVPVKPVHRAYSHVKVCFQLSLMTAEVRVIGTKTPPALALVAGGETLPGRMMIEYLRPGRAWLALLPAVARHIGLGRAGAGTWIVMPIAALAAAAVALASWAVLRELR